MFFARMRVEFEPAASVLTWRVCDEFDRCTDWQTTDDDIGITLPITAESSWASVAQEIIRQHRTGLQLREASIAPVVSRAELLGWERQARYAQRPQR